MGESKAPPLTGPSELGTSIRVTATPDIIAANGAAQSTIRINVRDAYNQPRGNVQLRVDVVDDTGTIVETGILSSRLVTTDSTGLAQVMFTAPTEAVPGVDANGVVQIRVQPISTDFGSEIARFVTIRLVPPTVVLVPGAPIPSFTFTPSNPTAGQTVIFNAMGSVDLDGTIMSYMWEWGDGESVTRLTPAEDHDFPAAGTYYVKLTVTDNAGLKSTLTKPITVQ
jgi:PKD repeat protein